MNKLDSFGGKKKCFIEQQGQFRGHTKRIKLKSKLFQRKDISWKIKFMHELNN